MILTNLIVCELLISLIGVPMDAVGAATNGTVMTNVFCPLVAFVHTLLGIPIHYNQGISDCVLDDNILIFHVLITEFIS